MFLKKPSHFPVESGVMTVDNVSATAVRRTSLQPFNTESSVPSHGSAEASVHPEKEKGAVFEQTAARKAVVASVRLMQNFSVRVISARTQEGSHLGCTVRRKNVSGNMAVDRLSQLQPVISYQNPEVTKNSVE
jgi:hypothetical protein